MGMRWRVLVWWVLLGQTMTVHVLGTRRTHTHPPAARTHHALRVRRRDARCVRGAPWAVDSPVAWRRAACPMSGVCAEALSRGGL